MGKVFACLHINSSLQFISEYAKKHKAFFHKGTISANANADSGLQKYLGIWTTDSNGNVVLKIPSGNNYDRFGGILYDVDPKLILAREAGVSVAAYPIIDVKAVNRCERHLRDTGKSNVKKGSLYTKVTFVTGNQIMGYEITLNQAIVTPNDMV